MIIWLGLIVLNLLASGPSGSSLMWISDFIATGRQLHVGSMVTSSNSELVKYRSSQMVKVELKRNTLYVLQMRFLSQLTFEWRSRFPTCTGPLQVPLTMLFYWGEKRDRAYNAERDNYVDCSQNYRQSKYCYVLKLDKLTCIQDIAMSPAHSSVVNMIPNQNTARTRKKSLICYPVHCFKILLPLRHQIFDSVCLFIPAVLTWTCLQSWPLAGSCIRRKVIGHLRETLMAVCSTPSSPLSVALPDDAATLLKFLLTLMQKERNIVRKQGLWEQSGR